MAALIILCTFVLLCVIVLVVSAPLRDAAARRARGGGGGNEDAAERAPDEAGRGDELAIEDATAGDALDTGDPQAAGDERAQLEVARETKYREIRDAELDFRTGKLSERDYRELDAELRAEALAILDELEAAGARPKAASAARSRSRRTGPRRRPSSD